MRSLRVRSGLGIQDNLLDVANIEIAIEFSAYFLFEPSGGFILSVSGVTRRLSHP